MSKGSERRTFDKKADDKFRKNKFWDKKPEGALDNPSARGSLRNGLGELADEEI